MGRFNSIDVHVNGTQDYASTLQTYGIVVLKPNIVDNRNVLDQKDISKSNTKYIVKWNFDLDGKTINIPKNCIIEIDGGCLSNGTLHGFDQPSGFGTILVNTNGLPEEEILVNVTRTGEWKKNETSETAEEIKVIEELVGDRESSTALPSHMGRMTLPTHVVNVAYWALYPLTDYNQKMLVQVTTNGDIWIPFDEHDMLVLVQDDGESFTDLEIQDVRDISEISTNYLQFDLTSDIIVIPGGPDVKISDLGAAMGRGEITDYTGEVKKANILAQSMINKPNTVYTIQYDFDLNGQTITVPENCVLKFEGGSLSNGILVGQGTSIDADAKTIFKKLKLDGAFAVSALRASWFGIYPGAAFKSTNNAAIENYYKISSVSTKTGMFFDQEGTYIIGVKLSYNGFKDADIFGVSTDTIIKIETSGYPLDIINLVNAENVSIHDLSLTEESTYLNPPNGANGISLITTAKNINIYNVNVYELPYIKSGNNTTDGGNAFTFQSTTDGVEGCVNLNINNCRVNKCASLFQIAFGNMLQNLTCNVSNCFAYDVLAGLQVYNFSPLVAYPQSRVIFSNNYVERCKVGIYNYCGRFLNINNNVFDLNTPNLPILNIFDNMGAFELSGLKNSVISNNQLREYTGENAISIIPISGDMTYNDDPSDVGFNENIISGNISSYGINIKTKRASLKTISTKNNLISGFGIAESNIPTLNESNIFIVLCKQASFYLRFISVQDYLILDSTGYTLLGVGFVYDSKIIVVSVAEAKKEFGTFTVVDSFKTNNVLNTAKDDKGKLNTYYLYNNNPNADTAVGYCVTHNTDVEWHLPSVAEMVLLFQNKDIINKTLSVIGGAIIRDDIYWTSTKINLTHTYAFNMTESLIIAVSDASLWVKPIFVFESDYYITNLTTPGFYKGDTRYYPICNRYVVWDGTKWVDTVDGAELSNVTITKGSTNVMNTLAGSLTAANNGLRFFNTDFNKWYTFNGANGHMRFEDEKGYYPGDHKGGTALRTTLTASLGDYDEGYDFYDTTPNVNKIYYFGFDGDTKVWRDAAGNIEH